MRTTTPRSPATWAGFRSPRVEAAEVVRLDSVIIVQSVLTIVPAMALVGVGAPRVAAYAFYVALFAFLGWSLMRGASVTALGLLIGVLPGLLLLRNLFLYNSVILLFVLVVGFTLLRSRQHARLWKNSGFVWVFYLCTLYWILSYIFTGEYFSNLRLLEMALSASAFVLLMKHRVQAASAMYSLMISLLVMGAAFLPYGARLGYATINGVRLGNPIQFGLPLALILTILLADQGKWMLLQRNSTLRVLLALSVSAMLLLSTSRGSWLVAAASVIMVALFQRRDRAVTGSAIILMFLAGLLLLHSGRGADLAVGLDRTFDTDRSLTNRTSGRSDQWMLLPAVMKQAPILGFGPGKGKEVYAKYSALDPRVRLEPGREIAWHSLYMQIAVETGAAGIAILTILLFTLFRSNIRAWRRSGDIMPVLGAIGYALIALTVSGMDAASGMYLGLALVAVHHDHAALLPERDLELIHPPGYV